MNKTLKPKSLRGRLFVSLTSFVIFIFLVVTAFGFQNTKEEISEVFDANLVKSAKLLLSLVKHEIIEHEEQDSFIVDLGISESKIFHKYEHKIHSQIWKDYILIHNSSSDISSKKPNYEGFRDLNINQNRWRSFSFYDHNSDLTIEVMEQYQIRDELILKILLTLFLPLLLVFPPLILSINLAIKKGLKPLTSLSKDIENTSAITLKPFPDDDLPSEIKPLIKSLNSLLYRISELMESERRFTDYAAHELRTPLAAIKTQAQLLEKQHSQNKDKQLEFIDLLSGIDRASHLIDQLLSLSRLEPEQKRGQIEHFNLTKLVEHSIANFYKLANKKNVSLNLYASQNFPIKANKVHFEMMLNNLLDNAVKYSSAKSDVNINLHDQEDHIILEISNMGDILSEGEQEKIFDKFYRGRNSKVIGCGLGLAIVKKIAEMHKAKIAFSSNNKLHTISLIISKSDC